MPNETPNPQTPPQQSLTEQMADPASPVRWAITSSVRILLPMLITWAGLKWAETDIEKAIGAVTVAILVLVSLFTSIQGRKKLLNMAPPTPPMAGDTPAPTPPSSTPPNPGV